MHSRDQHRTWAEVSIRKASQAWSSGDHSKAEFLQKQAELHVRLAELADLIEEAP